MADQHVHIHPQRLTGSSAHRWDELVRDRDAGALKAGTFYLSNLKGSTAHIVAPEEFSGSNYDQTFLQGVDVKTYEQATGYTPAKMRPNSDFNIIRSDRLGSYVIGLHVTSSATPNQHRVLKLDEPEYFDDNTSPASLGSLSVSGSKAQLDTSMHKRKARIHNKFYREQRDLGQANLFQDGTAYKDTLTVSPLEIIQAGSGSHPENVSFPEYMVHATDRSTSDGTIEVFPIRSIADRSNIEHPHTAQGIKSDLNIVDAYRKSDVMSHQRQKLGSRKLVIGRTVRTYTSILCNIAAGGNGDTLSFKVGGITCTITVAGSAVAANKSNAVTAVASIVEGSSDAEFATNLHAALVAIKALGVRITATISTSTVYLREALDRSRTRGVVVSATDADGDDFSNITALKTCGGFTIEYYKYSDYVYEGSKSRALAGYDYYLDGVESFGIEVLDNADHVKLLTASMPNPDSEDPNDVIKLDGYLPWLKMHRSGTFGSQHIGPINTQGFIAPEHAKITAFEDNSDRDISRVRISDANTFTSSPNFYLTAARTTITGRKYTGQGNLLFQASWLKSKSAFVDSSHTSFASDIKSRLSGSAASAVGSVSFKKTSPYFPESGHYAFKSSQGVDKTYPAVCVISGSHHFSGRAHDASAAGGFKDDSPWTVSYWMSGSDERADHFRSVRDIIHFRNDPFDVADHYPNVENFTVRHYMRGNYGYLYVSLFDNDFYPSNHHRVDFIFAGVASGSNMSWLRNSTQENSLYNTIKGGNSWNHLTVAYDGGMHSTVTGGSNIYQPSGGTKHANLLQALEVETRHENDSITKGATINAIAMVPDTSYVIMSMGNTTFNASVGSSYSTSPVAVGTTFTSHESNTFGSVGTATVRLRSLVYFDTPATSATTKTTLYNYGDSKYQPYSITGSNSSTLNCPIRLYLNGTDITNGTLEYINHYAVRTSGHNVRYGSDYIQSSTKASVTLTYTGNLTVGQTITLISTDTTSKTYEMIASGGTPSGANVGVPLTSSDDGDNIFTNLRNAITTNLSGHNGKIEAVLTTTGTGGTIQLTQAIAGAAGNTTIIHNLGNTSPVSPATFSGGTSTGDFRDIQHTGKYFKLAGTLSDLSAEAARDEGAVPYAGHTILESKIVLGGDPNSNSFNTKIQKNTSTNDFAASTQTTINRKVHVNQNTNYISEFAMWNSKLDDNNIKAVWELSKFNDVLFTVDKPMAAAINRMGASFEEGVDKDHVHETKGFVFGSTEHGTDSIAYGGLKK
jgi:hypothetical protein